MQRAASVLGVVLGLFLILDVVLTNSAYAGSGMYFGWLQAIVGMFMICGGLMIWSPANSSILSARIMFFMAMAASACGDLSLDSRAWALAIFPAVPGILTYHLAKERGVAGREEEAQRTALLSINTRYSGSTGSRMRLGTAEANAYIASISKPEIGYSTPAVIPHVQHVITNGFCTSSGQQLGRIDMFCGSCGSKIPDTSAVR